MKVSIHVPNSRIADMLVGAFEGGSNYWLESCQCEKSANTKFIGGEDYYSPIYADCLYGEVICFTDEEDGNRIFKLNSDVLENGLRIMAEIAPKHFGDMISENDDATTADVFLQCCLFGEVIYG
jgi:hypothetical protein